MKSNVKAALFSALVLPGVGQIYRGRLVKGGILMAVVSIVLVLFVFLAALTVHDILEVARVSGKIDDVILAERIRGKVPGAVTLGGLFLCIWLYGVVDALLDRGSENNPEQAGSASH